MNFAHLFAALKPIPSIESLASLKTVFKENGTVTPGNSSGINDGAAGVLVMKREEAERRNLKPLAKIVSWATCGVEPSMMGLGPIPATNKALKIAGEICIYTNHNISIETIKKKK